jgi:2-methylcitrate dehydratase PrpD
MTTTRSLADGLHRLAQAELPAPVRAVAERALVDALGAAVAAAHDPEVDRLVAHALAVGGGGPCPLPGRPERLDAPSAALVVGSAARTAAGHALPLPDAAAAVVVAAALPVVGRDEVAPARLLVALALGLETQRRVGRALVPDGAPSGWDAAGTVGPLGAAVTAAVLLGLDADRLRHAVAIATSTTLGHGEALGTPLQALTAGKAAANGLLAAALAAHGSTGAERALEGPRGLFRGLAATGDPAVLTAGLGEVWLVLDPAAAPGDDERLDAAAAGQVERTLPCRGSDVVQAVRSLHRAPGCSALLATLTAAPNASREQP